VATAGMSNVSLRRARVVSQVKLMRTRMVQVTVRVAGPDGRMVAQKVFVRADDLLPTPGPTPAKRGKDAEGNSVHHRAPGSDGHQPRQQDLFLTCGEPAGTLPTTCPFDRAHGNKDGRFYVAAAVRAPTFEGRGGAPGTGGYRARSDSMARRYPPCLLNSAGQSIDAQMDAQCERETLLAKWGVAGYGRVDDESSGYRAADRLFAGRAPEQIRTILRWNGLSGTLGPIDGGKGKNV